ncbi:hypothetical protein [Streptomyces sp. WZ-12]|uniref:hypothetical protein n=1 Tax=Streptomyces sp. WZ-12 TaxID=3030210 RepID=UPI002380DB45|nr:hypothetical protein [Streptomyces sp. WZ-12]
MKKATARGLAGLAIGGLALVGASPAFAMEAYSPSAHAHAWTTTSDRVVKLQQNDLGKSHADYYRTTDPNEPYHLWNKSGIMGSTATSGNGNRVVKMRACNWVKDNDDECGKYVNH